MRLFHISENPDISFFEPRPSPSAFSRISGNVVFAIAEKLLHNYLLPRDCPRVTYYAGPDSSPDDIIQFFGQSTATHIIAVESCWLSRIQHAILYCYELPVRSFTLIDECAAYYVSYERVYPLSMRPVNNLLVELLRRNVELRFMPFITKLAEAVGHSTLNYSLIRMHNAIKEIKNEH